MHKTLYFQKLRLCFKRRRPLNIQLKCIS